MASKAKDVGALTYEEARDELIEIVSKLEAGAATLDESLGLWERGEALAARCQELLDGAGERIAAARVDIAELERSSDAGIIGFAASDADADDSDNEQ